MICKFFTILLISSIKSKEIHFVANLKKDNGYHLYMNCSSSTPPWMFSAEFFVNNRTEYSMKYEDHQCYINRGICHTDYCYCTEKSFMIYSIVNLKDNYNNVSCHMRFQNSNEHGWHKKVEKTAMFYKTEKYSQREVIVIFGGKEEDFTEVKNTSIVTKKGPSSKSSHWIYIGNGAFLLFGIIIIAVVICLIKGRTLNLKEKKAISEEETSFEIKREGSCEMCTKVSVSAFCSDCKMVLCKNCCDSHAESNCGHKLFQIDNAVTTDVDVSCSYCNKKISVSVCITCKIELCFSCSKKHKLNHRHHSIKMLLRKHRQRAHSEKCNNVHSAEIRYVIRAKDENSRIYGVCILSQNKIVVCDYKYQELRIYDKEKLIFTHDLQKEPHSMTNIGDNKVAITFPYERQIGIYEVVISSVDHSFSFLCNDKPFNIAYNKHHLVVEIGRGDDGRIEIYDLGGKEQLTIKNNERFAYFTDGNTMRLALDMNNKRVFVSALSKQGIFCVDFKGKIKWKKAVISPRNIIFVPNVKSNDNIILSSKNADTIFLVNSENGQKNTLEVGRHIHNPRYIDYDLKQKCLCVHINQGDIIVYSVDITAI